MFHQLSILRECHTNSESNYISESAKIIKENKSNPTTVPIFENGNNYYIAESDLLNFMEASKEFDVNDALDIICKENSINKNSIVVSLDKNNFIIKEQLEEYKIVNERAVEDDASSLKEVMRWYNKFITASKNTKSDNIKDIDEKLKVLKNCLSSMESELRASKTAITTGKVKYIAKAIIPFNGIFRLIKRNDCYSGLAEIAGFIVQNIAAMMALPIVPASNGFQMGLRWQYYEKMLENSIKNTKEAIDYLEKKKKELSRK